MSDSAILHKPSRELSEFRRRAPSSGGRCHGGCVRCRICLRPGIDPSNLRMGIYLSGGMRGEESRLSSYPEYPPEYPRWYGDRGIRKSTTSSRTFLSISHSRVNPSTKEIDFFFGPGPIAWHGAVIKPPQDLRCVRAHIAVGPQIEDEAH